MEISRTIDDEVYCLTRKYRIKDNIGFILVEIIEQHADEDGEEILIEKEVSNEDYPSYLATKIKRLEFFKRLFRII
jgi:hypothetical protein